VANGRAEKALLLLAFCPSFMAKVIMTETRWGWWVPTVWVAGTTSEDWFSFGLEQQQRPFIEGDQQNDQSTRPKGAFSLLFLGPLVFSSGDFSFFGWSSHFPFWRGKFFKKGHLTPAGENHLIRMLLIHANGPKAGRPGWA
jgi:hypothetical protein